jgi:hypothetical protein
MRNDYTPVKKGKKVAKAVPIQKRIQMRIQKPMPPIVIVKPFYVL